MEEEDTTRRAGREISTQSSQDTSQLSSMLYKCYYFLFYIGIGSSFPYIALYFKQLGLTAGQTGAVLGLRFLTKFIGSPIWGIIGDKYKVHKVILLASLVSFTAGNLMFIAVQPQKQMCIETRANRTVTKALLFTPNGIVLGQEIGNTSDAKNHFANKNFTKGFARKIDHHEIKQIFIIFLTIVLIFQIIGSVVFAMKDAMLVVFLRENVKKFGTFRIWGEFGVAVGSFLVGGVISLYKSDVCGEVVKNYHISFYFFAGFSTLAIINVLFLEVKYPDDKSSDHPIFNASETFELLCGRNLIIIIVTCYFGILTGMQENFGPWYLDDLGAQPYMIGVAAGLRYCFAFLGYVSSGMCIDRIGLISTAAGCLLLYVAVFLGLAFVLNPWLGVVLHSIQGLLYGLGWSSCVVFGGTVSLQSGSYATVQGVIGGVHWGLGACIGVLVSGVIINSIGIPKTFFMYAMTSVAVFVFLVLSHWWIRSREQKEEADQAGYQLVSQNKDDDE
ncbi:major facilitator superfamily domain-containing protein 6-like [Montipora capricornis]|uniref:major facilitator superfamily domain-containing protein 6-like n=1 Tax=Montipora capricornis TaxID=246305 RepID=UPI0035F14766